MNANQDYYAQMVGRHHVNPSPAPKPDGTKLPTHVSVALWITAISSMICAYNLSDLMYMIYKVGEAMSTLHF